MVSKKLLLSGAFTAVFFLLLLNKRFQRKTAIEQVIDYTITNKNNFEKAIENITALQVSNSKEIDKVVNEEIKEMQENGVDIIDTLLPETTESFKIQTEISTIQTQSPKVEIPMIETSLETNANLTGNLNSNTTKDPDSKTIEIINGQRIFQIRNPDPADLKKLTKEQLTLEQATDPLLESARCSKEVFLSIVVISQASSFERREFIRSSWAFSYEDDYTKLKSRKSFPNQKTYIPKNVVKTVFIVGKPKGENEEILGKLRDEIKLKKDIVIANVIEDYRNLTLKTKLAIKWAYYECRSTFVIKTDDDVFINPVVLVEWLKGRPQEKLYTGFCNYNSPVVRDKNNKWYVSYEDFKDSHFPGYCLGGGYLMSEDVLAKVVKKSYGRKIFPMEDLYIGFMVKEIGGIEAADERKHFDLVYSGQTNTDCRLNTLFLAHRVLGENLIKHIKKARFALNNC